MLPDHAFPDQRAPWPGGVNLLLERSRWIRDELDPVVAADGPDALHPNDVLLIDSFLRELTEASLTLNQIRFSRIHTTLRHIMGHGTRWPSRLIERCLALEHAWYDRFGSLKNLPGLLYEPGGRLYGICECEEREEGMLARWLTLKRTDENRISAYKNGHLGFQPGDWWISWIFAFHDGIIDNIEADGGVTADKVNAYAVLLDGNDELPGGSASSFTYRTSQTGRGRYKLASAAPGSRLPIRILRCHSLKSLWAPRAGVRYEGLYHVVGWSIHRVPPGAVEITYDIQFKRIDDQIDVDSVLKRPWSDEVDDYEEYKRQREDQQADRDITALVPGLTVTGSDSLDGAIGPTGDSRLSALLCALSPRPRSHSRPASRSSPVFRPVDWSEDEEHWLDGTELASDSSPKTMGISDQARLSMFLSMKK